MWLAWAVLLLACSHTDGGTIAAPRPIAPSSTSAVTSQRPTLRWELAPGSEGAELTLCRDRGLTRECQTLVALGDRLRVDSALTQGWWYWGLRSRRAGLISGPRSAVWQMWVGARSADGDRDTSWGSVADFNGDGYADVVVGAPRAGAGGRVYVYYGSAAGVARVASRSIEGTRTGDQFGVSVASAGDVNGDGFADLVVGASQANVEGRGRSGSASVFHGSSLGIAMLPSRTLEGSAEGEQFGYSVASAGDVNGDGPGDVIVGAYTASPGGRSRAGTASVFHGSAAGISAAPSRTLEGVAPGDNFGDQVTCAGDVNGDGFADLLIESFAASPGGRSGSGSARVFHGSDSGILVAPARVLEGVSANDYFGWSVASAGDVNADGFADLVVGAIQADPGGRSNAGTASVFHGSAAGIPMEPARVLEGAAAGDSFGYSAAGAGDLNGDGFADLIVGATQGDPGGRVDAGTASVFLGSEAGIPMVPAQILEGSAAGDSFGFSVAHAFEITGPTTAAALFFKPPRPDRLPGIGIPATRAVLGSRAEARQAPGWRRCGVRAGCLLPGA